MEMCYGGINPLDMEQFNHKSHKKAGFLTSVVHITVTAAIDTCSCEKNPDLGFLK